MENKTKRATWRYKDAELDLCSLYETMNEMDSFTKDQRASNISTFSYIYKFIDVYTSKKFIKDFKDMIEHSKDIYRKHVLEIIESNNKELLIKSGLYEENFKYWCWVEGNRVSIARKGQETGNTGVVSVSIDEYKLTIKFKTMNLEELFNKNW